jgi:Acyl-CoA reductase (LuxC)
MTSGSEDVLDAHVRRRLATVDAALAGWEPGGELFDRAVADTVALHGYSQSDVERQLLHLVRERNSASALESSLRAEAGGAPVRGRTPGEVLHLVAGTVPGLAMESVLTAYVLGARSQLRPSRQETVLGHFLTHASKTAPALVGTVDLVGELRWATPDAAIVYGSDDTVELVRHRLTGRAVASYGSREGIAVVTGSAGEGWAIAVADDVLTFAQRGCMSPSHLFVLSSGDTAGSGSAGDGARAEHEFEARCDQLRAALLERRALHVVDGAGELAARTSTDDAALARVLASIVPVGEETAERTTGLSVPPARLTVTLARDAAHLAEEVAELGTRLQTAVLACATEERAAITQVLATAGCTRVEQPGRAHFPPAAWAHDGIGRFAPLLSPRV